MLHSTDRILTTHAGRLERPEALTQAMNDDPRGRPSGEAYTQLLRSSVKNVVREQRDAGIDVVCDGEFGKISWVVYLSSRLSGFEPVDKEVRHSDIDSQDRREFREFYDWAGSSGTMYYSSPGRQTLYRCVAPITYVGHDALREDIEALTAATAALGIAEAFIPSTAPGSVMWANEHYAADDEYFFALADALREEYRAIIDAGLVLQVDDPGVPTLWNQVMADGDARQFQEAAEIRIAALNHALAGLPRERIRYHVCWGSWHGPHAHDAPLEVLVPLLKDLHVGAWVFEAANVRHEHEWRLWQELGEDRILIPGVISHATDVIEHPRLVADRLERFASIVGPERVIAGTDCGLGYRVHPQIAWAKLRALTDGARLASERLYGTAKAS